jgi:phosphatidylglycerol:prolipoprotein diacylglycerol transferase
MFETAIVNGHHFWVNNLDPVLLPLYGNIAIRWYGLAYLAGFFFGFWMLKRWALARKAPLGSNEIGDFVMIMAVFIMLGGRLGYMLFYYDIPATALSPRVAPPLAFLSNPFSMIDISGGGIGGMASHGGIAGMALGALYFCWRRKRNVLAFCDMVAALAPFGVICGRLANFINGELWGRPSTVSWAFIFPREVPLPATINGVAREHLSQVEVLAYQIANATPRHPSQIYAVFLEGVFVLIAGLLAYRTQRPGLAMSSVLIMYAFGRFFGEFFREPDAGYELLFGWMSKGQQLTIPIFFVAGYFFIRALRQPADPLRYQLAEHATPQANSQTGTPAETEHSQRNNGDAETTSDAQAKS